MDHEDERAELRRMAKDMVETKLLTMMLFNQLSGHGEPLVACKKLFETVSKAVKAEEEASGLPEAEAAYLREAAREHQERLRSAVSDRLRRDRARHERMRGGR